MVDNHAGERKKRKQPPPTKVQFPDETKPLPDDVRKTVLEILRKYADCKCK